MKPILIAVVGGSASGKTTLARDLAQALRPSANLLSQDAFYLDAAHLPPARRARLNFDHPRRIDWPLLSSVLDDALQGRPVSIPRYSFEAHARETATDRLSPKRFLIAEGLWLLARRDIRSRCALCVFVACPSSERLRRRLDRDTTERGRTRSQVLRQWRGHTEPGFHQFVAPQLNLAHEVLRSPVAAPQVADLARRIRTLAEHQP
jgi:uridine kinase